MTNALDRARHSAAALGLAAALILLLGTTPAKAQAGGGASPQLAQASRQGGAKAPAATPSGGSDIDREVADLHKQLRITPQQEPQFNAFAEVMRSNAQDLDALMKQANPNQNANAVEELKQYQQFTETQAAGLKR